VRSRPLARCAADKMGIPWPLCSWSLNADTRYGVNFAVAGARLPQHHHHQRKPAPHGLAHPASPSSCAASAISRPFPFPFLSPPPSPCLPLQGVKVPLVPLPFPCFALQSVNMPLQITWFKKFLQTTPISAPVRALLRCHCVPRGRHCMSQMATVCPKSCCMQTGCRCTARLGLSLYALQYHCMPIGSPG